MILQNELYFGTYLRFATRNLMRIIKTGSVIFFFSGTFFSKYVLVVSEF